MNFKDCVKDTVKLYDMVSESDCVVVAFSGGQDSVALLYFLLEVAPIYKLKLCIAHLNHGLRGVEALRDERFCKKLGEKFGVPVFTDKIDVNRLKKDEPKRSVEELARRERYRFLEEVARKVGASKIATGHTADDQIETVLMRFVRGAGTKGLSGIPPKRKLKSGVWIVRPLICVWKEEILKFLKKYKISFVEDSTNKKMDFLRNRIRHELVPLLVKYNPGVKYIVQATGINMALVNDYLEEVVEEEFKNITDVDEIEKVVRVSCDKVKKLHPAVGKMLVRRIVKEIDREVGLETDNVMSVFRLIGSRNGSKIISLPKGVWVCREYDELVFSNVKKKKDRSYYKKVVVDGMTRVPSSKLLITCAIRERNDGVWGGVEKNINGVSDVFEKKGLSFEAELDYDMINEPIVVRSRCPGDRFRPIGMHGGVRKVKDIFVDEKVPKVYRDKIPILVSGNEICWIVGFRVGEKFKVTNETKRVLRIKVEVN